MSKREHSYQFKVSLKGMELPIWRRIEVPGSYSFWDLHVAIQDSMGWLDYHLHAFRVRNPATGKVDEIGIPADDALEDDPPCRPGWEVPLSSYFRDPGVRADYEYDFGDGWEHEVILENIHDRVSGCKYPRCLAGARACPPEDCGGVPGYEELVKRIRKPTDEEYKGIEQWQGGTFDPEAFDPKKVRFDSPKERLRIALAGD